MAKEIERKFLVKNSAWKKLVYKKINIIQGYVPSNEKCCVRIRVADNIAWLAVKGETENITRTEFEYEIPVQDARDMLDKFAGSNLINKTRSFLKFGDMEWIVDEFHDKNNGLVLAEIELQNEYTDFALPDWVEREVSNDKKYFNVFLARHPFTHTPAIPKSGD